MIGTLGDIVFEASSRKVRTWSSLSISGPARWAKHDVHLSTPVKEFLGPDLQAISLSLRLDAALGITPADELEDLREYRDTGEVLTLIIGGELIGDYVIASLNESWTRVDSRGVLSVAVVDVSLEEYA